MCRMHGAKAGAPKGLGNGAWRHGMATNEILTERRELANLVRDAGKQITAMRAPRDP